MRKRTIKPVSKKMRYSIIVEALKEGVYQTDINGTIIHVNNGFARMFGSSKKQIIGKRLLDFVARSDVAKTKRITKGALSGKVGDIELLCTSTKGSFPVRVSISAVKEKNKIIGLTGVIRDITERKKIEAATREAKDRMERLYVELKKVDEMKTQFLTITSHELKTPMTPTIAQAQMLTQGYLGKLSKAQDKSVAIILRNIKRLERLISDIFDISRIQNGQMRLVTQKMPVSIVIEEEIDNMRPVAKKKNIRLIKKLGKTPKTEFDKQRIAQVLRNLIGNAIKFTPQRGSITVESKMSKKTNSILISVTNTGEGIAQEFAEKIFEPFYQVKPSFEIKEQGTGLGLAICRGIVEQHGGKIWVESKQGKKTRFNFILPKLKRSRGK